MLRVSGPSEYSVDDALEMERCNMTNQKDCTMCIYIKTCWKRLELPGEVGKTSLRNQQLKKFNF